jgi:D-glycero-D-manno-heptose 1,7-bisphosphate phosphatase
MIAAGEHGGALRRRAVFLDRDGVINRVVLRQGRPYPPPTLDEFEFLPGVIEAVHVLHRAGFCLIIVTNQPDVATGSQRREIVEAMHSHIRNTLPVDEIKVCYHADQDGCLCRKPRPGMLLQAAQDWSIDLRQSFVVGDRWRDIEAGKSAQCKTILVRADYHERQADSPDVIVHSLLQASAWILSQSEKSTPGRLLDNHCSRGEDHARSR